jgi:hypothetical protein
MRNHKTLLFSIILLASLIANLALAYCYIHFVLQIDNVFTLGADYKCVVSVSEWTSDAKLIEFNVVRGQLLGQGLSMLYWGEMQGQSPKTSPIINVTNNSPDKAENITWVLLNAPVGVVINAYFVDANGNVGNTWTQGITGATPLAIAQSFQCEFMLFADYHSMPIGSYAFQLSIRCED